MVLVYCFTPSAGLPDRALSTHLAVRGRPGACMYRPACAPVPVRDTLRHAALVACWLVLWGIIPAALLIITAAFRAPSPIIPIIGGIIYLIVALVCSATIDGALEART